VTERDTVTQFFHKKAVAELADRDAYGIAEPGEVVVIDAGLQVRPGGTEPHSADAGEREY